MERGSVRIPFFRKDTADMGRFSGSGRNGETALEILRQAGVFLPADCGGRGTCGKCLVKYMAGAPEPTEEEKEKLSEDRLAEGIRLACRSCPEGDFELEYSEGEEESRRRYYS